MNNKERFQAISDISYILRVLEEYGLISDAETKIEAIEKNNVLDSSIEKQLLINNLLSQWQEFGVIQIVKDPVSH